jgi:hypothetical protein
MHFIVKRKYQLRTKFKVRKNTETNEFMQGISLCSCYQIIQLHQTDKMHFINMMKQMIDSNTVSLMFTGGIIMCTITTHGNEQVIIEFNWQTIHTMVQRSKSNRTIMSPLTKSKLLIQ